ncbi:MAG: hypothetical protein HW416_3426 [Chloroflexi bacterium]|nr:hypothetical protein [Chloroflexota bacterium]
MRTICSILAALSLAVLAACAPPAQRAATDAPGGGPPSASQPARSLVIAVRVEPPSLAIRWLGQPGGTLTIAKGLFGARIGLVDDQGRALPQLVEALPALRSENWRVFPDGRMETTYRLKPNLAWHDGVPLTSEDFVFAWRLYSVPENGLASTAPFHAIEEVLAPDQRTFVIRWRQPYAAAGLLSASRSELVPLPRQILEQPFAQLTPDGLAGHPYWTREYVGVGPYVLGQWEPGSFLEATAFDGYVLGRPKIDRVKLMFIGDPNTTLANLLAGEVHLASDDSFGLQQMEVLKREWGNAGTILLPPGGSWRTTFFQLRPEYASPPTILDPRVRKALAHALDKDLINDAVYGGNHILADSMISPKSEFGAASDRGVVKYPYDLRQSEQLMNEAGYVKGPDSLYASASRGRFVGSIVASTGSDFETELTVMAGGWRGVGFSLEESVISPAQTRDAQLASTFPFMTTRSTASDLPALVGLISNAIPRPENRWAGPNRGGWSNTEYDGLVQAFNTTLDADERARQISEMTRIYSQDLPTISLFFPTLPTAHVAALTGPVLVPQEADWLSNVHQWEFR